MITYTISGKPVTEKIFSERISTVANVKDYRLEQLGRASYRIMILPGDKKDTRSIKGSVLDSLVDIYGLKGRFEIDIITEDSALLPAVKNFSDRIKFLN